MLPGEVFAVGRWAGRCYQTRPVRIPRGSAWGGGGGEGARRETPLRGGVAHRVPPSLRAGLCSSRDVTKVVGEYEAVSQFCGVVIGHGRALRLWPSDPPWFAVGSSPRRPALRSPSRSSVSQPDRPSLGLALHVPELVGWGSRGVPRAGLRLPERRPQLGGSIPAVLSFDASRPIPPLGRPFCPPAGLLPSGTPCRIMGYVHWGVERLWWPAVFRGAAAGMEPSRRGLELRTTLLPWRRSGQGTSRWRPSARRK